MNKIVVLCAVLAGCALPGVKSEDVDAWAGQPVSVLETHPFFVTIPVKKTVASDGTQVWNYFNGAVASQCDSTAYGSPKAGFATGEQTCATREVGCNNLFYVREGRVVQYRPVASGGARCVTTAMLRPVAVK